MPDIDPDRLVAANRVLATFRRPGDRLTLEAGHGRLYLVGPGEAWCHEARLRGEGLWFWALKVHRLMAGTEEQATAQMVRWLRGKTRRPRRCWEHWTSPAVGLGNAWTLPLLDGAGYFDPARVGCVLCGLADGGQTDWWWRDALSGPACTSRHAPGCRARGKEAARA